MLAKATIVCLLIGQGKAPEQSGGAWRPEFLTRYGYKSLSILGNQDPAQQSGIFEVIADEAVIEDMRIDDLYVSVLSWEYL